MPTRALVNSTLLLIALIWGFGFAPQRLGMQVLDPAAFNGLRFLLGALTLLPLVLLGANRNTVFNKQTLLLGMALGSVLFAGAIFQQYSIQYTSLANVAFITGLYAIIVPLIGLFLGYRYSVVVWSGGVIATIGMYFLAGGASELALKGDLLALAGAVFWATHILILVRKAGNHHPLSLAMIQFFACSLLSFLFAMLTEDRLLPATFADYLWPAVNGIIVVGIGYTLQVLVMDKADPFTASLILALEAVFGAIAGYWVFAELLDYSGVLGAALMLFGCVLAQIPNQTDKSP